MFIYWTQILQLRIQVGNDIIQVGKILSNCLLSYVSSNHLYNQNFSIKIQNPQFVLAFSLDSMGNYGHIAHLYRLESLH